MSFEVLTANGGSFEGGFLGADTSRVMLGDLPVITMKQFCKFSTEVLLEAIPKLDESQLRELQEHVSFAQRGIDGVAKRHESNPYTGFESIDVLMTAFSKAKDEGDEVAAQDAGEAVAQAMSETFGNMCVLYEENPFTLRGDVIAVGDQYEVVVGEFASFVSSYLRGGALGWGSQGIPDYAAEATRQLSEAVGLTTS